MLLALDLSTRYAGIALTDGPTLLAEMNWRVEQRHGADVLEVTSSLLARIDASAADVRAIGVALGPGSFNGLRVALATAKALAFALNAQLVGVPTLDVIAWGARPISGAGEPIWSVLPAERGDVFAARYNPSRGAAEWAPDPLAASSDLVSQDAKPDQDALYLTVAPHALASRIAGSAVFVGEWREEARAILAEALGDRARFGSPLSGRRAVWLAELAQARIAQGRIDDPRTLEPLYLRRPNITTSRRATMGALAAAPHEATRPAEQSGVVHEGEEDRRAVQS